MTAPGFVYDQNVTIAPSGRAIDYANRPYAAYHARREGSRWFVYGYAWGNPASHIICRVAGAGFKRRKVFGRPVIAGFRTKAEAAAVADFLNRSVKE